MDEDTCDSYPFFFFFLRKPQVFWCDGADTVRCALVFITIRIIFPSLIWGIATCTTCLPHKDAVRITGWCLQIWQMKTPCVGEGTVGVIKPRSRRVSELGLLCSISLDQLFPITCLPLTRFGYQIMTCGIWMLPKGQLGLKQELDFLVNAGQLGMM